MQIGIEYDCLSDLILVNMRHYDEFTVIAAEAEICGDGAAVNTFVKGLYERP